MHLGTESLTLNKLRNLKDVKTILIGYLNKNNKV